MQRNWVLLAIALLLVAAGLTWVLGRGDAPSVTNLNAVAVNGTNRTVNGTPEPTTRSFASSEVPGVDPAFQLSAEIPSSWLVEAVPASQSLNVYDPAASGETNLERSQFFIRYFQASTFLTLTTVEVKSRTETTVSGRPAVTYIIEKKTGVADFANQPSWRNREHTVTDIRSTDASPTIFYVFANAPDVPKATVDAFLNSIRFGTQVETKEPVAVYPMAEFASRITKKRFGQYITKANSPVQPERFSGYHTAVDLETTVAEQSIDVPVYAIADGTVVVRRTADGYGGVVLIRHTVDGETVTAVYGHVRLASVGKAVGETVQRGERIAFLGTGFSTETDGERKHLHFGILKGSSTALAGYVGAESALSSWYEPVAWLAGWEAVEPEP